jgi:hypothetical protein
MMLLEPLMRRMLEFLVPRVSLRLLEGRSRFQTSSSPFFTVPGHRGREKVGKIFERLSRCYLDLLISESWKRRGPVCGGTDHTPFI